MPRVLFIKESQGFLTAFRGASWIPYNTRRLVDENVANAYSHIVTVSWLVALSFERSWNGVIAESDMSSTMIWFYIFWLPTYVPTTRIKCIILCVPIGDYWTQRQKEWEWVKQNGGFLKFPLFLFRGDTPKPKQLERFIEVNTSISTPFLKEGVSGYIRPCNMHCTLRHCKH